MRNPVPNFPVVVGRPSLSFVRSFDDICSIRKRIFYGGVRLSAYIHTKKMLTPDIKAAIAKRHLLLMWMLLCV